MTSNAPSALRTATFAACSLLVFLGCGGESQTTSSSQTDTRAPRVLVAMFNEFMAEHGGRSPKDEAEFREFLATRSDRLEAARLTADQLLTSPRGERALVVVCGTRGPLDVDGKQFVAYEAAPVDGSRMVVHVRGGVELIDEATIGPAVKSAQ
jgi:hypothetical protein